MPNTKPKQKNQKQRWLWRSHPGVIDDRGDEHEYLPGSLDSERMLPKEVFTRIAIREQSLSAAQSGFLDVAIVGWIMLPLAYVVLGAFGSQQPLGWVVWPVVIVLEWGVLLVLFQLKYRSRWMQSRERVRLHHCARVVLADGICPACSYPLEQCDVESDDCRVCSECSSAWCDAHIHRYHEMVAGQRSVLSGMSISVGDPWSEGISPMRSTDARGTCLTLIHKKLKSALLEHEGDEQGTALQWLREHADDVLVHRSHLLRIARVAAVVVLIGAGLSVAVHNWTPALVSLFSLIAIATVQHLRYGNTKGDAYRDIYIQHNVCPWCAASLSRVLMREDGMQECADCGCAIPVDALTVQTEDMA